MKNLIFVIYLLLQAALDSVNSLSKPSGCCKLPRLPGYSAPHEVSRRVCHDREVSLVRKTGTKGFLAQFKIRCNTNTRKWTLMGNCDLPLKTTLTIVGWEDKVFVSPHQSKELKCEIEESDSIRSEDCRFVWRKDDGQAVDISEWNPADSIQPAVYTKRTARGLSLHISNATETTIGNYICLYQHKQAQGRPSYKEVKIIFPGCLISTQPVNGYFTKAEEDSPLSHHNNRVTVGTKVRVMCDRNYQLSSDSPHTITCSGENVWKNDQDGVVNVNSMKCIPQRDAFRCACIPQLAHINNGEISFSQSNLTIAWNGQQIAYSNVCTARVSCEKTFIAVGRTEYHCQGSRLIDPVDAAAKGKTSPLLKSITKWKTQCRREKLA